MRDRACLECKLVYGQGVHRCKRWQCLRCLRRKAFLRSPPRKCGEELCPGTGALSQLLGLRVGVLDESGAVAYSCGRARVRPDATPENADAWKGFHIIIMWPTCGRVRSANFPPCLQPTLICQAFVCDLSLYPSSIDEGRIFVLPF